MNTDFIFHQSYVANILTGRCTYIRKSNLDLFNGPPVVVVVVVVVAVSLSLVVVDFRIPD